MQKYLDIMNHFGLKSQKRKLNEECYEFLEAVTDYEELVCENECYDYPYTAEELDIFRDHIVEEMGDMLILLTQFIARYNISKEELDKWMDYKLLRTEHRIRTGFYDKDENVCVEKEKTTKAN